MLVNAFAWFCNSGGSPASVAIPLSGNMGIGVLVTLLAVALALIIADGLRSSTAPRPAMRRRLRRPCHIVLVPRSKP